MKKIILNNLVNGTSKITERKLYDTCINNENIKILDEYNGCVFDHCNFVGDYSKTVFIDCIFKHCDLSNSLFNEVLWQRVEINDCKLVGTELIKSIFKDISINQSIIDYATFAESKFNDCIFNKVNLVDSILIDTCYEKVVFKDCELDKVNFFNARLKGLYISKSNLKQISLSGNELTGLVCNSEQAIEFAILLGLIVKD